MIKTTIIPGLLILLIFFSCRKNNSSSGGTPIIRSISLDSGHYATVLTITGANFDSAIAGNIVTVDSVKAIVQNVTATSLTISVPTTHTGKIIVKTAGGTGIGPVFTYLPDILVSGYLTTTSGGYAIAYYWENGVATALTDGLNNAAGNAIASSDNDIYVAGHEYYGRYRVAKIWKNGVATALTAQTQDADASGMQISGNHIYVAGFANNGSFDVAMLWKDGMATPLSDGSTNARATSLVISGNDVYVAGYQSNGSRNIAMVWKNGVGSSLTDGTYDGFANSIAIAGNNDIYTAGYEIVTDPNGFSYVPMYWKNGLPGEQLEINGYSAVGYANAVAVAPDYVYIAGQGSPYYDQSNDYAVIWILGSIGAALPGSYEAYGLTADSTDIYAVGTGPVYWKNGIATNLHTSESSGIGYSIFIRK
jgi:hypothetical protein